MISFQARYISPALVMRQEPSGYKNTKVSFVELDTKAYSDFRAIEQLKYFWGKDSDYISDICESFLEVLNGAVKEKVIKFFALTAQDSNFEKLNSDKILGIVEFEKVNEKVNHINYIQAGKNFSHYTNMPEYKYIGSALLNLLKSRYSNQDILLLSTDAGGFYKKNGFEELSGADTNYFLWRHK